MAIYVSDYLLYDFQSGATAIAGFEASYALGAIGAGLSGILLAQFIKKTNLIRQIIIFLFLTAGIYFLIATTRSEWILIACAFMIGITNAGTRILRVTYIVRIVPNHMIGRVSSMFKIINTVLRASLIMVLLLPFFSGKDNGENIVYAIGIMGVLCFISGLVLVWMYKRFDHTQAFG